MPTPKRHGGTNIVKCCQACHDMKDRIPMFNWHAIAWKEINNSWPTLGRYTRIWLSVQLAMYLDCIADNPTKFIKLGEECNYDNFQNLTKGK